VNRSFHRAAHPFFPAIRRVLRGVALAAIVAILPAPLAAQSAGPALASADAPAQEALRPGDVIRLRIWREPDLSGDFVVDERGRVVLPKVGRVQATDEGTEALKERVVKAYEASLNHSSIEVTFLRRIQVAGAVRTPGLYPADPTLTLADIVVLAGGVTPQGRADRVEIRRGGRLVSTVSVRDRITDTAVQSGDQVYVAEKGWASRNPGVIAGVTGTIASLLVALLR
jgi:polysaccharide export outer membrane protein